MHGHALEGMADGPPGQVRGLNWTTADPNRNYPGKHR
jgi:hypothetical protein